MWEEVGNQRRKDINYNQLMHLKEVVAHKGKGTVTRLCLPGRLEGRQAAKVDGG